MASPRNLVALVVLAGAVPVVALLVLRFVAAFERLLVALGVPPSLAGESGTVLLFALLLAFAALVIRALVSLVGD